MGMFKMDADRLVSISAIIVSVGTLFLIIYQTNLYRQQQKAAVLPYLEIGVGLDSIGSNVHVTNNGTGPAFVKAIEVRYSKLSVKDDPYGFYLQLYKDSTSQMPGYLFLDRVFPGRLIPAGQSVEMLAVHRSPDKVEEFNRLFQDDPDPQIQRTKKATIIITYSSVYGDTWVTQSDWQSPKAVH